MKLEYSFKRLRILISLHTFKTFVYIIILLVFLIKVTIWNKMYLRNEFIKSLLHQKCSDPFELKKVSFITMMRCIKNIADAIIETPPNNLI